jgi:hypothetical protein
MKNVATACEWIRLVGMIVAVSTSACRPVTQSSNQQRVQATPQPSGSPVPGSTDRSFRKWTNSQVLEAFKEAGLEVENVSPMTRPDDYAGAPVNDAEGTKFYISSAGAEGAAGRIHSFTSASDQEQMIGYYAGASASSFAWVFVKDNIVVQINGRLPEKKARLYEAALSRMKQ